MRSLGAASLRYPGGLLPSLALFGAIIAFALVALAAAGNWPKVLRVGAAATIYTTVLLASCRNRPELGLGRFIAAGAAAGVASGLLRPSTSPLLIGASILGASLLLGPLHWLALRTWQRTAAEQRH